MKSVNRFLEWLLSRERRRATRQDAPELVAHYWDGAAPMPRDVRDISSTGIYLVTEERWYPGTQVLMTLQIPSAAENDPDRSILVNAKVVRFGTDGVGLQLVMPENGASRGAHTFGVKGTDRKTFHRFLRRLLENQGQALIEYALVLPLVFLLIVNVVNFGGFFCAFIDVANAARAGADYAILGFPSAGNPPPVAGTGTTITNLITADMSSLPNRASLVISICEKNSSGTITLAGTCTSMPSDPEAAFYTLTTVDVTYTYKPFIPLFSAFGISATIPPTTIHRRAVMRSYI
jgi:Flp pilus assembly protein TadG